MMRKNVTVAVCAAVLSVSAVAHASFNSFVIRNGGSGSPTIQPNNTYVPGATEFIISEGGMKAGLGSDDINGLTIGDITQLGITRYDDTGRFSSGSGPAVAPYFNIWVTDGMGNYAVIANEPSNPAFQSLYTTNMDGSKTYNLSYADLSAKVAKVYETPGAGSNTSWVHAMFGAGPLTFADVASLQISPPPASYITNAANAVGTGAPDELGTNVAYGFNWVFGDTLSNYVSGMEGYVVSNFVAAPEPASAALLALGGLALIRRRR
ncbi:MAG TPA: PEP-CTERM sorting domain-containing protein [Phycisphaerae bacterium]|nr:PEP-CTERM sorting domain-containing protein [Phycisphaerae bacterium]HRW53722.1 PEP-CTERM sorting domain-containing protein [Phycisphaerae bacterium]